ncbi:MAG: 2OG-Fe(II) oxygenase [Rhizobiaceae bacterium]
MTSTLVQKLINPKVVGEIESYATAFQTAKPFPNLSIDDFFKPEQLSELLQQFPSLDESAVRVEDSTGKKSRASLNRGTSDISKFPPAFAQLDKLMSDPEFLSIIERITGIDGLVYDPRYLGGGIKVSNNGARLPRHIDFNYHQSDSSLLRCLNLLFYFNTDWDEKWGGNIQVHDADRINEGDSLVRQYAPIAGRLFMFATNKVSYHAFDAINAPADPGRKSFGVYFYKKVSVENAPTRNTTMYVEDGLPDHLTVGASLTESDISALKFMLSRRDTRISDLYNRLNKREQEIGNLFKQNQNLRERLANMEK